MGESRTIGVFGAGCRRVEVAVDRHHDDAVAEFDADAILRRHTGRDVVETGMKAADREQERWIVAEAGAVVKLTGP